MPDYNYGPQIIAMLEEQKKYDRAQAEKNRQNAMSPASMLGGALTGFMNSPSTKAGIDPETGEKTQEDRSFMERLLSPETGVGLLAGGATPTSEDVLKDVMTGGYNTYQVLQKQKQQQIENLLANEKAKQEVLKDYNISQGQPYNYKSTGQTVTKLAYKIPGKKGVLKAEPGDEAEVKRKYPNAVRAPEFDEKDEEKFAKIPAEGWVPGSMVSSLLGEQTYLKPRNKQLEMWKELLSDPTIGPTMIDAMQKISRMGGE